MGKKFSILSTAGAAALAVTAVFTLQAPTSPSPVASAATATPVIGGFVSGLSLDGTEKTYALAADGTIQSARDAKSYTYLSDAIGAKVPARWNKCKPITYMVNPAGMPEGALAAIPEAIKKVAKATKLKFRKGKTTSVVPFEKANWASPFLNSGTNTLVIAASNSKKIPQLGGTTAGYGGPIWVDAGAGLEIKVGGVVVNSESELGAGFTTDGYGNSYGQLLLHEIGHALNLGHVMDEGQVMFPALLHVTPSDYADGDRAGLAKLSALPCFK